MKALLFERPWLLLALLIALQFMLICIWSWRRTPLAARAVWVGFGLLPALPLISHLVVTERERVMTVCRELARFVDDGNVQAIALRVADDFEAGRLDRSAFLKRVREALTRYRIDDPRLWQFEVSFDAPDQARVEFSVACRVRSTSAFYDRLLSRWRATFERDADRWLITRLEAVPTPMSPIRNLRDWLR